VRLLPDSPRNQRFLAITLLLIAVLLAYLLLVHWWFVAPHLALRQQRYDLAEQQHRYAELIRRRPLIEKRLEAVAEFDRENQAFLSNEDPTSAFSDLSERLKRAKEHNVDTKTSRCSIQGVSPTTLPSHEKDAYQRVSAAVVMNCEPEVLAKILYELESGNPYLFVDRMVIYRQQPMYQPGAKTPTPATMVGVQFTLSGYLRKPSGKQPAVEL
jgi:general secretion pathway protein M